MMSLKFLPVILLALFSSCIKDKKEGDKIENYIEVDDKIPEFTVKDIAGKEITNQDLYGSVTLLVFFMTTCPDCERELPKIEKVWKRLHENPDFKLVAISRAETTATLTRYREQKGFTMPLYLDPGKEVFSLFANSTIPRVYMVNRENIVTWMGIEKLEATAEQLIEKIESLIKNVP